MTAPGLTKVPESLWLSWAQTPLSRLQAGPPQTPVPCPLPQWLSQILGALEHEGDAAAAQEAEDRRAGSVGLKAARGCWLSAAKSSGSGGLWLEGEEGLG